MASGLTTHPGLAHINDALELMLKATKRTRFHTAIHQCHQVRTAIKELVDAGA
jgi:hypothetical protein